MTNQEQKLLTYLQKLDRAWDNGRGRSNPCLWPEEVERDLGMSLLEVERLGESLRLRGLVMSQNIDQAPIPLYHVTDAGRDYKV